MRTKLMLVLALLVVPLLAGCASVPAPRPEPVDAAWAQPDSADRAAAAKSHDAPAGEPAEEAEESRSLVTSILLYLPNRILDIGDIVWAGVDVGPGVGVQVQATEILQAAALTRTSVGVGFQGFRDPPVKAGADAVVAVGPLGVDGTAGLGWKDTPTAFRVELHPLIAGAHVGVDPLSVLDAVLGFVGIDLEDDDL